MEKINQRFTSIDQVKNQYLKKDSALAESKTNSTSFEDIFKQKQADYSSQELKFSKHAASRLTDRNISLTQEQNERLENGVEMAQEKGIRDSLVIVDSLAFIVNVPSKTVVTAMEQADTNKCVFTNIDGAVIT